MTESLPITLLESKNVLLHKEFRLEHPSKLTKFVGANGQGKTSALHLLSLAIEGSTSPRVIHDGADKGEILVEFLGYKLRRTFTPKGSYIKITDADGRTLPSPQKFLDELAGELRFNPLAWLSLDSKEQIRILLQAIDVRITAAEIAEATGMPAPAGIDYSKHGVLVLDDVREHFAAERKIENMTADRKKKAAAEARAQLPPDRPVVGEAERAATITRIAGANIKLQDLKTRQLAAKDFRAAVERIERDKERLDEDHARLATEISDLERMIAAKRTQQQDLVFRKNSKENELLTLNKTAPPTADEFAAVDAEIKHASLEVLGIQELDKLSARFDEVAKIEAEANTASAQASILDGVVKVISSDLRRKLMAKAALPVDSLAIEDNKILVDGHELTYVAESQQIRIALAIAKALNPKLKVILLDGTERLDGNTMAAFIKEIEGDGYQYFCSEVTRDGESFRILSFGVAQANAAVEAVA